MAPPATNIALEEHFIIPSFLDYLSRGMLPVPSDVRATLIRRLSDFGEERLSEMNSGSVRKSVLSISGPGVQIEPDAAAAARLAADANDALAEVMRNRPDPPGRGLVTAGRGSTTFSRNRTRVVVHDR